MHDDAVCNCSYGACPNAPPEGGPLCTGHGPQCCCWPFSLHTRTSWPPYSVNMSVCTANRGLLTSYKSAAVRPNTAGVRCSGEAMRRCVTRGRVCGAGDDSRQARLAVNTPRSGPCRCRNILQGWLAEVASGSLLCVSFHQDSVDPQDGGEQPLRPARQRGAPDAIMQLLARLSSSMIFHPGRPQE